ncbi:hypothetical protein E1B28_007880 [Marasmius oreades]|uniref:Uncharacterized protein n=1 Tax=Marasmius oreades TaxID=181124 RepID=A0A9P7UVF2_9AGAR|nr:uncharacterized protein E1B28_007880 [Marasmius oreades]KAG7094276.1 hypothetical protein E1B28_007880 [Marasmius oreades]
MSSVVTLTPSYFSSHSTSLGIDVRTASTMDSLVAIGFGLGLRFVVNFFGRNSIKISSVIIGLWEGIVTLHFMQKLPHSYDPYIAYGVRMFVDYIWTANVVRLALVLIWTGMGMVLADIAPGIWYQTGMKRTWDQFRRDLYLMSRSMPRVALTMPSFKIRLWSTKRPRTPTVRFSPPRTSESASVVSDTNSVVSASTATPTVITNASAEVPPPTSHRRIPTVSVTSPTPATTLKKPTRLPGHFIRDSETETDRDTTVGRYRPSQTPSQSRLLRAARARERERAQQQLPTSSSAESESNFSVDGAGTSSGFNFTHLPPADELDTDELYGSSDDDGSSSTPTEVPDPDSVRDITEELEQERRSATPTNLSISLPPADAEVEAPVKTPLPPPDQVPDIPDGDDEDGGWEHVKKEKELAPPVPSKDRVEEKRKEVPYKYEVKERDDVFSNAPSVAVYKAASSKGTSKFGADDAEEEIRSKQHSRSVSRALADDEAEDATSKVASMSASKAPTYAGDDPQPRASKKAVSKAASKAPTEAESHTLSKAPSRSVSKAPTPAPEVDDAQSHAPSKVGSRAASKTPSEVPTPVEPDASSKVASKARTNHESQSHIPSRVHSRTASRAPEDGTIESQSRTHSRAASGAASKAPTPPGAEADSQSQAPTTRVADDSQSHVQSKVASRAASKTPSRLPTPAPEVEDSQSRAPSKVQSKAPSQAASKAPTRVATPIPDAEDSQSRVTPKVQSKAPSQAASKVPTRAATPVPEAEDSQFRAPSNVESKAPSQAVSKAPTRAATPQERDEREPIFAPPSKTTETEPEPEPEPTVPVHIELGSTAPAFKAPSTVPSAWGSPSAWGGGGGLGGWGWGKQSVVKTQTEPPKPKKAMSTFSSVLTPNDSISNIGITASDSEEEEEEEVQQVQEETGQQGEPVQEEKKEHKEGNKPEVPPLTREPSLTGTQAIASVFGLGPMRKNGPGSDLINLESNVGIPTRQTQTQPPNNTSSRPIPNMPDRISERDEESEVPGTRSGVTGAGVEGEGEDKGGEGTRQGTPPPSFSTLYPDDFTVVPDQPAGEEEEEDVQVDEPLPEGSGRRLARGLELKVLIKQMQRDIDEATRQMESALEDGQDGAPLAEVKREVIKQLEKEKRKLVKRREIVLFSVAGEKPEKVRPEIEFAATDNPLPAVDRLDRQIVSLLERGDQELNITFPKAPTGKTAKAKVTAMKAAVLDRLKELDLDHVEDPSNARLVKVTLPVKGEL